MKLVCVDKKILVADRVESHGILSRVGRLFPDRTHLNSTGESMRRTIPIPQIAVISF